MIDLPWADPGVTTQDSLPDESLFLIDLYESWYGDILIYLQTQNFQPKLSKDDRRQIFHQARHYLIVGDTLYYQVVHMVLCQCVTHNKGETILNDFHFRECVGHLSGIVAVQKYLTRRILFSLNIQRLNERYQKMSSMPNFLSKDACPPFSTSSYSCGRPLFKMGHWFHDL